MSDWHSRPLEQVMKELDSRPSGLTERESAQRLERLGPNQLEPPRKPSVLARVLGQLKDPMILVLLGAAALSLAASGGEDWLDGAIILIIVLVNGVISITQEDHAQQALEELRRMSSPQAHVLREGRAKKISAAALVPGDVILLEAGDMVPADARVMECSRLQADESAMTGESVPVEKGAHDRLPEEAALGDRTNMVLSGTMITAGRGTALVVATGMDTQMGRIANLLLEDKEGDTPLQRKMGEISKSLSFLCLSVCAVMFGVGLIQGKNMLDMFLTAVSLAVAAIPEGLPAIVTIVLALGVQRMAARGAIVKKLPAVETLGCASVICSDKTGTLTQNRMTVQELWTPAGGHRRDALLAGCLCSDARLEWKAGAPTAVGDPTEGALVVAAAREGVDQEKEEQNWPRTADLPFDSGRKLMSTIHAREDGSWTVFVKGAPDILLERCVAGPRGPLSAQDRRAVLEANEAMAQKALRVIAVARRELHILPPGLEPRAVESGLTFLGLFGLMDPPRPEVKAAVARCHLAGVRPVMITGDHRATAAAVARELDIIRPGEWTVTGGELDFMPQEVLEEDIEKFAVFARVTPEHKMRIVKAWQKRGHVVAMTGDGVNDAPALKTADIGCAMGVAGTDVAKGAAHMILTDDNFSTIVSAIEEGRGIYSNIRKAIHYLLSCNIGEIFTIFAATLLDFGQMPLVPVQLLWLNLVTDSLPALALGVEPVEEGVMEEKPRDAAAGLFDQKFSFRLAWQGLMVGGLTLAAYFLGFTRLAAPGMEGAVANTMAFATLTLCQLFHAFNVRSEDRSLFAQGALSNPAMNRAFLVGMALQLSVLLVPPLQGVFAVTAMDSAQWLAVFGLAAAPIPICEITKALGRKGERGEREERSAVREKAKR
ncbi:Calcium-transporting ATPase [uncultured Flavonifractor sp.]|uniref:P-type Ca(2+) transporter n=1 Tax=Flintibacter hominis TaxID=2763048 RepID=A0A8J6JA89_9FIRM|nr:MULTISPECIES: cation-translocating P-type ATPase [Eubacteriales]MBC5723345.1 cation-translocating P-type ATPase [Flintibacter hominis]MCH1980821.1 cation-translocating P-type ATPase [Lawsonibacter sp. OA9]SCI69298.1 Calcium-transporting ATPase [uncultured Flavonifractor sp.]